MERLDSAFSTFWNKGLAYIFFACLWGITIKGLVVGNPRSIPLCYVLPVPTILVFWWFSYFKHVTLDGDTLIIRGFRREAHIPGSAVERVVEHRRGKGLAYITIIFRTDTEFGRRVRIMVGTNGYGFDRVVKRLRVAMEGKNIAVKIKHAPRATSQIPANGKEMIVSGWTVEELTGILTDFANKYDGDLGADFDYEVQPDGKGSIHIMFPHDIPAPQFSFLINYVQYPENRDFKTRSISVIGNALITPEFHPPTKSIVGQNAIFYIPLNDRDYDLVYVHVGNDTFENSFAARRWKKVADSRIPPGVEIKQ